jgi:hypothetical protein
VSALARKRTCAAPLREGQAREAPARHDGAHGGQHFVGGHALRQIGLQNHDFRRFLVRQILALCFFIRGDRVFALLNQLVH